jgi:Uma2 family endonuclease
MQAAAHRKRWTDDDLMALPRDGRKYELLGGELVVNPTGFQHGYISVRLATVLMEFVLRERLGLVVGSNPGFRMASGACLSPDVSFVRKQRLRSQKEITTKFFEGAPDLAVEVVSPGESQKSLKQKLAEYFENGTRLAWVVNTKNRTVSVYTSADIVKVLRETEQLEGEGLLPGFVFRVGELVQIPDFGSEE